MRQRIGHGVARTLDMDGVQTCAKSRGAIGGVVQTALRGVFRRQHDAAHVVRPDRVGGDGCDQRGIDAARQAQNDLAEARLAQIFPQAQHHRVVILFPGIGLGGHQAGLHLPTLGAADEIDMRDRFLEGRKLDHLLAAGVQHEAGAVVKLIVLPAHHVHIDQRQAGLDHAPHHVTHAQIQFFGVIGAAIGHHQNLGAGLGQRLGHVGIPAVLADRAADPGIADDIGSADRAAVEQAQFIEQLLVGQVMLQDAGHQLAVPEDEIGVIQLVPIAPRTADTDCGAVHTGLAHRHDGGHRLLGEGRLQHQILRLIAGDEHFRQRQHIGAGLTRGLPRLACLAGIARQVADGGVQLPDGQAETVGHGRAPCVFASVIGDHS